MSLTLLLDEDISYRVVEGLRRLGVDAVSVHELGRANRGVPDEEQLAYAAAQGRALVTYNRADYQALDAAWRASDRSHAGIVWCSERAVPRRAIGPLVQALSVFAGQHASLTALCLPLGRPQV